MRVGCFMCDNVIEITKPMVIDNPEVLKMLNRYKLGAITVEGKYEVYQVIYVDMMYDSRGNLFRKSLPYEAGNSPEGYITYQYDNLQRLVSSKETFSGVTYSSSYTYDDYGRVSSETYPSGFTVRNRYNGGGYLIAVNDSDNNTLWQADEHDIYGHLTEFHTGNGLTTYRDYDSENGRLLGIITGNDRNIFQNYTYTYDDFGNFASRNKNASTMLSENFTYDFPLFVNFPFLGQ